MALYWAQELAAQNEDSALKNHFIPIANKMLANEEAIVNELNNAQGKAMDVGGYYAPIEDLAESAMRPSAILNSIISDI